MSCYHQMKLPECNYKDPNEILSEHIPYLKGLTKIIIKMLCKQYRIIQITQEQDNYFEDFKGNRFMVNKPNIIISYQYWNTNDPFFKPFYWEFNPNDLQIF